MLDVKNLLQRKTVRNFLPEKIKPGILKSAIQIACRAPTGCCSRPAILLDISNHARDEWLAQQKAPLTAPHLFLFAGSKEIGARNAKKFLFKNFDKPEAEAAFKHFLNIKDEYIRRNVYLVAGYFAATLEAAGISTCCISGFNKRTAKEKLDLDGDYYPELIFACGYVDKKNPSSHATPCELKNFYYPKTN